jgi:methionyl-tRNA formyltransferase
VVAVITQPDKPAGRGRTVTPSPVKQRALLAAVPVLQPPRLRDAGWPERLTEHRADVAVVAAFGQILPKAVLDVPAHGSINVHASVLPRYRGAAPIAWAIMRGETETGISTFQMDPGMDTGDLLLTEATPIGPEETAGELSARLAEIGARLLLRTLEGLATLPRIPQDHAKATLAPRLKKEDGWLRPAETARDLVNRVRGCNPWPGAALITPAGRLLIWRATAVAAPGVTALPGTLVPTPLPLSPEGRGQGEGLRGEGLRGEGLEGEGPKGERAVAIATGDGLLVPLEVQPENRKAMPWADFLRGARLPVGARVGEPVP